MSTSDQRDPADEQHTPRTADALAHSTATDVTSYLISGPVAFGLLWRRGSRTRTTAPGSAGN